MIESKPKRGRPSVDDVNTIGAGDPETGESVGWSNGRWYPREHRFINEVNHWCTQDKLFPVPTTGAIVAPDIDDPIAVLAVLAHVIGPQAHITVSGGLVDELDALRAFAEGAYNEFELLGEVA